MFYVVTVAILALFIAVAISNSTHGKRQLAEAEAAANAQAEQGLRYFWGNGVEWDMDKAAELCRKAVEMGTTNDDARVLGGFREIERDSRLKDRYDQSIRACCIALLRKGYKLHLSSIFKSGGVRSAVIVVYNSRDKIVGNIWFYTCHLQYDISIGHCYTMRHLKNRYLDGDELKHIIYLDGPGIKIESETPRRKAPPDWLVLCAAVLELHYDICYPEWVEEYTDAKEYVNAAFQFTAGRLEAEMERFDAMLGRDVPILGGGTSVSRGEGVGVSPPHHTAGFTDSVGSINDNTVQGQAQSTTGVTQGLSLDDELSQIEALLDEYEIEIKDGGRFCGETVYRRISELVDPKVVEAKIRAGDKVWVDAYHERTRQITSSGEIDISRLQALKLRYPTYSRIYKVGNRAVEYSIKRLESHIAAQESSLTPDLRSRYEDALDFLRSSYSTLFLYAEADDKISGQYTGNTGTPAPALLPYAPPPPVPPVPRFANIFDAAKYGAVEDLRRCVENGADVNAGGDGGITPLFVAAGAGQVESIKCLAALGANVNATDSKGETPIFTAAQAGQVESIKCLVGLGADVNARDYGGATPMLWAAGSGQQASMECLAHLRADVNAKTINGITPMLIAVATGNVAGMICLKSLGAQIEVTAHNGRGPALLDIAIKNGQAEAAEWLRGVGVR